MGKTKPIVLVSALALLLTGGVVQAGHNYEDYKEDVGAFNGSAFTDYQKQTGLNGTEEISVDNDNVGGNYTVDIRAQRNNGVNRESNWMQDVGDNMSFTITRNYIQESDSSYRLQISNDLSTPVKVEVYGMFKTF